MSREKKYREPITPRDVLIPLGVGFALGVVTFAVQGGFKRGNEEALWHAVCDALTVPGILLTGMGLLSFVSEQGAFDGLSFGVRKAFGQILSEKRRNAMPKTYYDYVTAKREKQRTKPRTTLFVGLGFLVLAGIALAVYMSLPA